MVVQQIHNIQENIASTIDSFPLARYSKLLITYSSVANGYVNGNRVECQIINKETNTIIKTIKLNLGLNVGKKTVTTSIADIKDYEVYINFELILLSGCTGATVIYDARFE